MWRGGLPLGSGAASCGASPWSLLWPGCGGGCCRSICMEQDSGLPLPGPVEAGQGCWPGWPLWADSWLPERGRWAVACWGLTPPRRLFPSSSLEEEGEEEELFRGTGQASKVRAWQMQPGTGGGGSSPAGAGPRGPPRGTHDPQRRGFCGPSLAPGHLAQGGVARDLWGWSVAAPRPSHGHPPKARRLGRATGCAKRTVLCPTGAVGVAPSSGVLCAGYVCCVCPCRAGLPEAAAPALCCPPCSASRCAPWAGWSWRRRSWRWAGAVGPSAAASGSSRGRRVGTSAGAPGQT